MVDWQTGDSPGYCSDCQKLAGDHPCYICEHKAPDVLPTNHDVLELWGFCATQFRTSMGGPYGLDMLAVLRIAEALDIEETPALMERLRVLEAHTLSKIRKREEAGQHGQ